MTEADEVVGGLAAAAPVGGAQRHDAGRRLGRRVDGEQRGAELVAALEERGRDGRSHEDEAVGVLQGLLAQEQGGAFRLGAEPVRGDADMIDLQGELERSGRGQQALQELGGVGVVHHVEQDRDATSGPSRWGGCGCRGGLRRRRTGNRVAELVGGGEDQVARAGGDRGVRAQGLGDRGDGDAGGSGDRGLGRSGSSWS